MNSKININAPILAGKEAGGVKLREHIQSFYNVVSSFSWYDKEKRRDGSTKLYSRFHIGYECKDTIVLIFHVLNGKLMKIIALDKYQGNFRGVKVGMPIEEAMKLIPELSYEEDEEYYYLEGESGIKIETDPMNNEVSAIVVHISELDDFQDDFDKWRELEKGNW